MRGAGDTSRRSTSPTPLTVPPVPTPATNASIDSAAHRLEDLARRRLVRGPRGLAGLSNCCGRNAPGVAARDLARLGDRSLHLLLGRRQDDLRAEGLEQLPPLEAHALRHRQDAPVAAHRAHERQTDAGVPARRLDDDAARLERSAALRLLDHRQADAVLHRAAGVRLLHLRPDRRTRAVPQRAQPDERRVPDELEDVVDQPGRCHREERGF